MKTRTTLALTLLAAAAGFACGPKADTANPGDVTACTEEAMVCPDGSSVSREGPACEFAACPEGEPDEEAAADGAEEADEAAADEEAPADEADADEADAE